MTAMVLDQPPELLWGSFALSTDALPDVPWTCTTLATTEFGDAVPIIDFVESSLIVDGGDAVVTGWERRAFTVEIRITAPDGQAMSQAQQALFALVHADEKPPLLWTPPMVGAWTGAFDVIAVKFLRKYDAPGDWSHRERFARQRVFKLEFTAKTWVRDPEPIVVPALPVPPGPEPAILNIDTCDSLTGWSSPGSIAQGPGFLEATSTGGASVGYSYDLTRTGTVSLSGTPYVRISAQTAYVGTQATLRALFTAPDGTATGEVAPVASRPSDLGGRWIDYYFAPGMPTLSTITARSLWGPPYPEDTCLRVTHIARTDTIAGPGSSGKQVARLVTIEGAAPTGASVVLEPAAGVTGTMIKRCGLIYTGTSEVIPLRALDSASAPVTTNATYVSGGLNDLSVPTVSLVPVSRLTDATYDFLALLSITNSSRIYWSARIVGPTGAAVFGSDVVASGDTLVAMPGGSGSGGGIFTIARIALPPTRIPDGAGLMVEVKLWMPSGGNTVQVDERWLADTINGAVTVINVPPSVNAKIQRVEIQSPQLGAPRYQVLGDGIVSGSSVTVRADISRFTRLGRHRFPPGELNVYTVTDGEPAGSALYSNASLKYYRKFAHDPGPPLPAAVEA